MSLLFFKKSSICQWLPKLQAHRGYHMQGIQENTLAAIQKAFQMGYEMAEFDVHQTADGIVVLHHDALLKDVGFVRKLSLDNLRKVKNFDTLEDVLVWLSQLENKSFKLNIEIKSKRIFSNSLEKKVCALIKKYNLSAQVMISSFNPLSLMWVRFFHPSLYRALLLTFEIEKGNSWIIQKMGLNFLARPHVLNLRYQDWSKARFATVLARVPIVLWTCNDLKIYQKNKEDIYGIISDEITPEDFKKAWN